MTTHIPNTSAPINITQRIEDFYRYFQEKPGVPKYLDAINDIFARGENTLVILYEDLLSHDSEIADMLREDPELVINDAIEAFKNTLKFNSSILAHKNYFVRFSTKDDNGPLAIPIRGLRAKHIDKLVWFKGITIRSSTVRPKLTKAKFECGMCGVEFEIPQLTSQVSWPRSCVNTRCKSKSQADFRLISKKSEFIDWQSIMIQEMPEELPSGRIPRSVQAVLMHEDLVDAVKPGDRVRIMGVFKSVIAQSIKSIKSTLFKSFIEVNYIDPEDKVEDFDITKEDKEQIELLSKEPMIQKKIARSLAPTIYGRDDLKMACALALFSGTRRKKPGGGYKRGDIHVLFMGDPGTGKSIHGSEKIYVGNEFTNEIKWEVCKIGSFIDSLLDTNEEKLIKKGETEILKTIDLNPIFTASINPNNLKTQKSLIKEVSRHKASVLIKLKTESGRSIITTPDHSFTTLIDGKLKVLTSKQLIEEYQKEKLYLPIARQFLFEENSNIIDMNPFFDDEGLVHSKIINNQISLYDNGLITLNEASINSNVARSTILSYRNKPISVPNGDWIRRKRDCSWIPRKIPLNRKFGEIIGLYLAEGDLQGTSIRFTNTNLDIITLLQNSLANLFGTASYYQHDNTVQLHRSSLTRWFEEMFGTHAERKQLPDDFLFTPTEFRLGLLSGYFTGDGTIEKENLYIDALTASKELAYSISDLFCTLGIFSTIGTKVIKSGKYRGNKYYKIILTGDEVLKFYQKGIGLLSSGKQERLERVVKLSENKTRYQKKDIIPNFGNILQRISKDLGLKGIRNTEERDFLAQLRGKTQRQRCGRHYLQKIVKKYETIYKEKGKNLGSDLLWLKTITESDIFWDKVIEIEVINGTTRVYDIGTEDEHFIVANGNIITHNSEVLKSAVEKSPRGLYTSGKGSTAVGLTAAVLKDSETSQMNLEAGAVVLANGGVAAIDEFDKMDTADRSALHEAMEQQTVSIAKAGIVATLKSQTAIIAAANPHSGRYNEYKSFAENVRMPPSLLSRFDLIFKVVDKPDPAKDAQMAEFILSNATASIEGDSPDHEANIELEAPIDEDTLKKYIKYARRTCHPTLSGEAKDAIKSFYLDLRGQYDSEDAVVSILARNLDALVRLSEAHAKMALREEATKDDVQAIIRLFKRYLKDTGYDKETGKFDIDMIIAGQSRTKLNKLEKLLDLLKQLFEENEWKALEKNGVIQRLEIEGFDKSFVNKSIEALIEEGTLYQPSRDKLKMTGKDV